MVQRQQLREPPTDLGSALIPPYLIDVCYLDRRRRCRPSPDIVSTLSGVLLYEMAVGKMPFRGNDENELLWNVCYEQIHYPMFLTKELTSLLQSVSSTCFRPLCLPVCLSVSSSMLTKHHSFLFIVAAVVLSRCKSQQSQLQSTDANQNQLLEREPTKRMGMSTCKAGDIYDQAWFKGVDWRAMEELRVPPPFVPDVVSSSRRQLASRSSLNLILSFLEKLRISKIKIYPT